MSQPRRLAGLLALTTFALYLPVAWYGFVNYDDNLYITENPIVQAGVTWAGVKWAFTTGALSNWNPLAWLSFMTDCGVFGLNPAGPHLVNVLFHAANTALLFGLLLRLTAKVWPAAVVAALFAWHPLHVESVAWISERKDVLSTFFALLALLNYARYVEELKAKSSKAKVYFAWCLAAFALGLMAKPMLVTLPCVMLLLDFWPLNRVAGLAFRNGQLATRNRQLLLEKWPLFLLTAVSCSLTYWAQKSGGSIVPPTPVPLLRWLGNAPVAVVGYLGNLFWPSGLCVIYPRPDHIAPASVGWSVAVLLLISAAAWQGRQTKPYLLTGWLWFVGTLVPVLGLVQIGTANQAMADRYTYIPAIGFFIAVVFLVRDLVVRIRLPKIIVTGATIGLLLACILAMEHQLQFWRDSETLFRRAVAVTHNNDIALVNLGAALEGQGRYEAALAVDLQAEQLTPNRYQIHHNLGNLLDQLGRPAEALTEHRAAARLGPEQPFLHYGLGTALVNAGQTGAAVQEFYEAARLDAHDARPHLGLAEIYLQQNRGPEAVDELRAALRADPNNIEVLTFTAQVLAASENPSVRNGQGAFVLAAKANLLTGGGRPTVLDVLGMACAEMGKFDEAQMAAQQALAVAEAMKLNKLEPVRQRLELYKNHQPWRESFGVTNLPAKN